MHRHHKLKAIFGIAVSVVVTLNALSSGVPAQSNGKTHAIRGFSEANAATQITWEEKMRAIPKPELLREYMKHLSAEPHHVGSAYDKQNAEWIRDKFRSWGLDAKIEEFDVLFPTPTERVLE
ncbi:MAG TPA: hypothetical protein VN687_04195, partial [Blastocatellia bacterium]|nr:hypothetical protein [Blastocatellia bacterium]